MDAWLKPYRGEQLLSVGAFWEGGGHAKAEATMSSGAWLFLVEAIVSLKP